MKANVAILAGGYTGEYDISIKTGENIKKHLESLDKYNLYSLIIDKKSWSYKDIDGSIKNIDKNDFSIVYNNHKVNFDAVFVTIHGTPGEDGKLGGYFDMLNIPYCMSDVLPCALTFNKKTANQLLQNAGISKVANSIVITRGQDWSVKEILSQLNLPLFVKPNEGGSSLATFKADDERELEDGIIEALKFDDQVLLEEYIQGREFSVGVYEKGSETIALPVTELITDNEFFDYEAKYNKGLTDEVTPADIPEEITQKLQKQTLDIFKFFGCTYLSRIDFIWCNKDDQIYFLEVNTMPGQSDASIFPQQVVYSGISMPEFYAMMVDQALHKGSKI